MESVVEVQVKPIRTSKVSLTVVGKTPLIMDRMPEGVKEDILNKQVGKAKGAKKKTRDLENEASEAIHMTSSGQIGFPAEGFKKGMIECTSFVGDKFFSKKLVQGAVRIINQVDGLVPIQFKKRDILRHNIAHNIKFSPQFHDWSAELIIEYDSNTIAVQDIVGLLNYAGFYVGIGAWRPKCGKGGSGSYGTYEVKTK